MPKKYSVKIDNKEIEVKDGFVLKEELNETLDSGTIQFLSEDGEANIDPFDSVIFEGTKIDRKKLLVDTYNAEIENFKETLEDSDYLYTINLFSETKLLERITLPNLSITKRPDGSVVSVFDKIKEYCRRYLPYIKVYDEDERYFYKPSLRYDEALETKFAMECPEFVWNTPTLKEVLMDLFSLADCIPVIKDNVLTFFDLTYKGNAIDTTKLTNRTISKTSADYCDSLTLPMKNIISKQPVVVFEHLLPHSQSGEMTSNNAVYITRKPIYKIRKCYIYSYSVEDRGVQQSIRKLVKADITSQIVEKAKYDQLENGLYLETQNDVKKNKCGNLYFERGKTTINGIGLSFRKHFTEGGFAGWETFGAFAFIGAFDNSLGDFDYYKRVYSIGSVYAYGYDAPFIELEYETIEETVVNVSKSQPIKNKQNSLFDSQSANSVDLEHQTIFEYAKANRLSSKIETIEGTYENESDIPQLGDYIGNKILYSREVSYYDDVYIFRGQLCENYILRNYFTGITSKRRSWSIVDANEAVLRQDYYKFYILFSTGDLLDDRPFGMPYTLGLIPSNTDFINFFENFTYDTSKRNIYKMAQVSTWDKDEQKRPYEGNYYAMVDLMIYEIGNSFVFSTQQNDNYSYGDKIIKDDSDDDARYLMDPQTYADSNGEFIRYRIRITSGMNESQEKGREWDVLLASLLNPDAFSKGELDALLECLRNNPIKHEGANYYLNFSANFTKDNREIPSSAVQFEYLTDATSIFVYEDITKLFSAGNRSLIDSGDLSNSIGIKKATNHHYKQGETTPVGTEIALSNLSSQNTTGTNLGYKYTLADAIARTDSWCIYSKKTGKVLIAINGTKRFSMNLCFTRDFAVYNSQIDQRAIGDYMDEQETLDIEYSEHEPEIEQIKVLNRTIDIADTKDFN